MNRRMGALLVTALATVAVVGVTTAAQAAGSGATRIAFAPGTTSGEVTGQLGSGGEADYVFGAAAGQTAVVQFDGPHNSRWVLVSPSGSPLHNGMTQQQRQVTLALPETGDYRLDVETGAAGRYTLDLTIPVRIRFAPGATSGTVSGNVAANGDVAYLFGARAGQVATVHFTGPRNSRWTLVSPSGSPLHTQMTQQQSRVTVTLPETGDYWLDVLGGDAGRFSLTLQIPAG